MGSEMCIRDSLTGEENLQIIQQILKLPKSSVKEVLELTGLYEHRRRPVSKYSLGMKQRLGLAGALMGHPPVLILDEATSSIDTRTEKLIEKGMDALMDGRTVFVIAHRLSTVRNSKAIMVLEKGEIIERGSHEELIDQRGRYYKLYTGQFELE